MFGCDTGSLPQSGRTPDDDRVHARERPKLPKSMWPPRAFGDRIAFSDGGRRSSALSAIACRGTARVLSRVLVFLRRPFAYTRRT
jgi:hypothetical protein